MTTQGWRRLAVATTSGAIVLAQSACASMSSVQQMRGEPAADLSAVKSGASRGEVEARVGAPVRTWITQEGVEYRLYRYDGGVPPDPAAAFLIPIDVLTLGLPTLLNRVIPEPPEERERRMRTLAVSYDRDGVVLGVFVDVGDFAALPADGKPRPRP
jgi:hypothetical protein